MHADASFYPCESVSIRGYLSAAVHEKSLASTDIVL
jgi:hypothetical protein